jgi:hypothetical protein
MRLHLAFESVDDGPSGGFALKELAHAHSGCLEPVEGRFTPLTGGQTAFRRPRRSVRPEIVMFLRHFSAGRFVFWLARPAAQMKFRARIHSR